MYVEVIIPLPVGSLYTYTVPKEYQHIVHVGSLVLVPFVGAKRYTALVTEVHYDQPSRANLKSIDGLADESVSFSKQHIEFIEWMSEYYISYYGDTLRAALPIAFRLESITFVQLINPESEVTLKLTPNENRVYRELVDGNSYSILELQKLTRLKSINVHIKSLLDKNIISVKEIVDPLFKPKTEVWLKLQEALCDDLWIRLKRATAQTKVLKQFQEAGQSELLKSAILQTDPKLSVAIRELCKRGVLIAEEREIKPLNINEQPVEVNSLTPAQETAFNTINNQFEKFNTVLLHGVTSSGKTEIYIKLIEQMLNEGKQTLFLLPEIALTIQIIKRLKLAFGNQIGVYHSGMSDRDRADLWRKQCSNDPYKIILGVRSSIFLPFTDLGLVIVDEEHDTSYKQREPSPRYHGRDAALMLAKIHGAKSLLGSATPSFESYKNVLSGKFGLCELTVRHGNYTMPQIKLADTSDARKRKVMKGSFTPLLISEMKRVLEQGNQVILFQNRRGYSTFIKCDECGHVPQCPACDVSMTYYKGENRMMCRYCGRILPIEVKCKECGSGTYRMGIPGTEKIVEEIHELFPNYSVDRIDTDSMSNKSKFRNSIAKFESGETKILVGTQMIAKGLDFGGVKLVGVIDADPLIHLPDFRAEERAFAQLMQVSGRCGRRGNDGVVVIQTSQPKRPLFEWIMQGNFELMFNTLANERKEFNYPPFSKVISIELRHKDRNYVRAMANQAASFLRERLGTNAVEGPAEPEISKIGLMYRISLLLKLSDYNAFIMAKMCLMAHFEKYDTNLRVIIDVDTY